MFGRSIKRVFGVASALIVTAGQGAAGEAFPGAVGYGSGADGWKSGAVIAVTTLADDGPGSLRACATRGPRAKVCMFQVGGTIVLDRPLHISPNTYIAGQTAPGQGIELRLGDSDRTPVVIKNTQNVVVRFLKIRPGLPNRPSANVDAVTIENAEHIYLDHLSLMFASDEVLNIHVANSRTANITVANSIIAYGLDNAGHPKGRHSKGALVCSDEGVRKECGRISLWRNLFAHNRDRNPDIKATEVGPVEIVGNVFYNPISQFGEFYDLLGNADILYSGNHALTGPNTIGATPEAVQVFEWEDAFRISLTARDNLATDRGRCLRDASFPVLDAAAEAAAALGGEQVSSVPEAPAADTLATVLARAGDHIDGTRERDRLDQTVVDDVANCTGRVIDDPAELGPWSALDTANAPPDTDGDLLPDAWESASGLDPSAITDLWSASPIADLSVIEVYLATRAGDLP